MRVCDYLCCCRHYPNGSGMGDSVYLGGCSGAVRRNTWVYVAGGIVSCEILGGFG